MLRRRGGARHSRRRSRPAHQGPLAQRRGRRVKSVTPVVPRCRRRVRSGAGWAALRRGRATGPPPGGRSSLLTRSKADPRPRRAATSASRRVEIEAGHRQQAPASAEARKPGRDAPADRIDPAGPACAPPCRSCACRGSSSTWAARCCTCWSSGCARRRSRRRRRRACCRTWSSRCLTAPSWRAACSYRRTRTRPARRARCLSASRTRPSCDSASRGAPLAQRRGAAQRAARAAAGGCARPHRHARRHAADPRRRPPMRARMHAAWTSCLTSCSWAPSTSCCAAPATTTCCRRVHGAGAAAACRRAGGRAMALLQAGNQAGGRRRSPGASSRQGLHPPTRHARRSHSATCRASSRWCRAAAASRAPTSWAAPRRSRAPFTAALATASSRSCGRRCSGAPRAGRRVLGGPRAARRKLHRSLLLGCPPRHQALCALECACPCMPCSHAPA
jgi:hypothetical protein